MYERQSDDEEEVSSHVIGPESDILVLQHYVDAWIQGTNNSGLSVRPLFYQIVKIVSADS